MTGEELEALVGDMRRLGVAHLKTEGIELTLVFGERYDAKAEVVAPLDKQVEPATKTKVGLDGLTPEEQADLYGKPMSEFNGTT